MTPSDALRANLDMLLYHWDLVLWKDFMMFSSDDIACQVSVEDCPPTLKSPMMVKRLGYIFNYAQYGGKLSPNLTMVDIVRFVTDKKSAPVVKQTSDKTNNVSSLQTIDKKLVPQISSFSGLDEDFEIWKDQTTNSLGSAGLGQYLTNSNLVSSCPEVSESIFYALRGAVQKGGEC